MNEELDNCPFCDHEVSIASNRDWHRTSCDHSTDCPLHEADGLMVPATPEGRAWLVSAWNRRAAPSVASSAPADELPETWNFQQLQNITNWLLSKDALKLDHTEEEDGFFAPAYNIIASIESMIAAAVLAERAACADIVDNADSPDCGGWNMNHIAERIRARN